jgi:hypothetical protein
MHLEKNHTTQQQQQDRHWKKIFGIITAITSIFIYFFFNINFFFTQKKNKCIEFSFDFNKD